ncbi:GIY-YIG nuclease family protein [Chloroflexota bacterium]
MFRRKNKNTCGFWDCNKGIPDDDFLCTEHHEKWVGGLIDRCPKCGRFKDIMYHTCLDCYVGRRVKPQKGPAVVPEPKQQYRIEYSETWTDGYMGPEKRFIYILEFDDGTLYIGHTTDIHSRLSELREQKAPSTARQKPRLGYLEIGVNEEAADLRVAELKKLLESNPDQVGAMLLEFHHHMQELGFE